MKTITLLLAEYERATIPLSEIRDRYFGIKTDKEANKQAGDLSLPVPAFRLGGVRSPYMVKIEDLAEYIDRIAAQKKKEWEKMNAA